MISLPNGKILQYASELPDPRGTEIFLDIESQNNTVGKLRVTEDDNDKDYDGRYPFKGDRIAGFAFAIDDGPGYYVPIRHTYGQNLPIENVRKWLRDALKLRWINHNIISDAVFVHHEGVEYSSDIVDTLTLAKTHDSDRFGHGLKELREDWLNYKTESTDRVQAYLRSLKSRNWGDVPIDILGEYAIDDILSNRELYQFLVEKRHPDLASIWETEIKLSSVLYDAEINGLCIRPNEVKVEAVKAIQEMILQSSKIAELTGLEFTNSSACIYDMLINQFGLPILVTKKEKNERGYEVDTGRATFNWDAMQVYLEHPLVVGKIKDTVEAILAYRDDSQFKSLFADNFLVLEKDGIIHPSYNQIVRTGRMSCRRPNIQQQNKRSKSLIHPHPGYGFLSCDYSQIEFRLIVHYIRDEAAIKAYLENPKTDFHKWVASLIGCDRPTGKTMNFAMAYGQGPRKTRRKLAIMKSLVEEAKAKEPKRFEEFCNRRADEVYNKYHETLPGIKRMSLEAENVAKKRGYVKNLYGRHRHIPWKRARIAFNSVVQGSAMDIMKERMVELSPRWNQRSRDYGLKIAANVHDEVLLEVPSEHLYNTEIHDFVCNTLEHPKAKVRVPIVTGIGVGPSSWAEAAAEDAALRDGKFYSGALR